MFIVMFNKGTATALAVVDTRQTSLRIFDGPPKLVQLKRVVYTADTDSKVQRFERWPFVREKFKNIKCFSLTKDIHQHFYISILNTAYAAHYVYFTLAKLFTKLFIKCVSFRHSNLPNFKKYLSVNNECKCQILSLIYPYTSPALPPTYIQNSHPSSRQRLL